MGPRDSYLEFVDRQCEHQLSDSLYNGVGSERWYLRWVNDYIPDDIVKLFEPAAKWHDVAYNLGGTDEQRMFADTHFEQLIMDVAYTQHGIKRIRARFWARLCFAGVRTGGELSWAHRDCPLTVDSLLASVIVNQAGAPSNDG